MLIRSKSRHAFFKAATIAGISSFALTVAWHAHAQTSDQASQAQGGEIGEIVVTAQRRAELLQDVPAAIIAQTGEDLSKAAIFNIRDLTQLAPGVQIAGAGLNVAPAIRGVFSGQSDPGNDGNIAIYVDDVYQASQAGNSLNFPDIERVEVLKGPQGTLFGRNAAGGAIRFFTVEPNLQTYTGSVTLGVTTFHGYTAKGYVAGPIVPDVLAFSFSASSERDNGYHYDIVHGTGTDGRSSRTARFKLLFAPTSYLKNELFASFNWHTDGDVQAYQSFNGNNVVRIVSPSTYIPSGDYNYTANLTPTLWNQRVEFGDHLSFATDWGDISWLTAKSVTHVYYVDDGDFTDLNLLIYPAHQNQYDVQSELLFNSKKFGDFQFTVGGNYYEDVGCYCALNLAGSSIVGPAGNIPPPPGPALVGWQRQTTYAWAGFLDANYDITSRLNFAAGIRYSSEKRVANDNGYVPGLDYNNMPFLGSTIFNDTSPRGSLKYKLTDMDDNVYYTYSEGFKAGGFNISGVQKTPFQAEKVKANEIGLKTSPSRVISANLSAFYYDYSNQQVEIITGFTNQTVNAARSRMYGADGDILGRVTDELSLDFSFAYLQANYLNYHNAPVIILTPNCLCGGVNGVANLSGHSEPYSPKWTFGLGADYHHDFGFGKIEATGRIYRSDEFFWTSQLESLPNPAYTTVAATVSYTLPNTNISFEGWGKNLTGARYYASTFVSPVSPGISWAAPRQAGFNFKYAF
jgi:iron complex outermembrane receptor protein